MDYTKHFKSDWKNQGHRFFQFEANNFYYDRQWQSSNDLVQVQVS